MSAESHGSSPASDDVAASIAARRSLGPDSEDAVIAAFLDRTGESIDRRVEERVAAELQGRETKAAANWYGKQRRDSQALALAIVSLVLAVPITILAPVGSGTLIVIWLAIVALNLGFRFSG
ncbi:hypothetical protein [Actinoalloteichus hymeniacidonis]|nr:hypothetical protein [Actinoalloteichus hymeniacidonis]MBB5909553.1 hypothetical protein [Actinoalloteichus hymeniacidonis]